MEAIILAGGFGTRLSGVVSNVPKPMAPINGKPFLEYLINYLSKYNVEKIILSVGYKYEVIKDYFGSNFNDIEIVYSIEDTPLGTGGAVKLATEYITKDSFLLINGDTFFDIDLNKFQDEFLRKNSDVMLALKHMINFDRYGTVECDVYGKVIAFKEKTQMDSGNINGGAYLFKTSFFLNLKEAGKFSLEQHLEDNFKTLNISGSVYDSYFKDIGIPEDYFQFEKDMINCSNN